MSTSHRTIRRTTVPPTNVLRLMEAVGPSRAAALIGVSTTLLHRARRENGINQVVETAAGYAVEHLSTHAAPLKVSKLVQRDEAMFLMSVPKEKADIVERFAEALGAELVAA